MNLAVQAQNLQFVDLYPALRPWYRFVPACFDSYKRQLREIATIERPTFMRFLDMAKANLAIGKVFPSKQAVLSSLPRRFPEVLFGADQELPGFINDMISANEKDRMTDDEIARTAGHGFSAAAYVVFIPW